MFNNGGLYSKIINLTSIFYEGFPYCLEAVLEKQYIFIIFLIKYFDQLKGGIKGTFLRLKMLLYLKCDDFTISNTYTHMWVLEVACMHT